MSINNGKVQKRERENKNWFYSYNVIFDANVSEHAKIIYCYLCRCADSEGQSFPGVKNIGEKCGVKSKTTIHNALNELELLGLICKENRFVDNKNGNKSKTTNNYIVFDSIEISDTLVQEMDYPSPLNGLPLVHQMDIEVLPVLSTIEEEEEKTHPTLEILKSLAADFEDKVFMCEVFKEMLQYPENESELEKVTFTILAAALKDYKKSTSKINKPVQYFSKCLLRAIKKAEAPKQDPKTKKTKQSKSSLNKVPQANNYPQRQYDDEYYESLYDTPWNKKQQQQPQ